MTNTTSIFKNKGCKLYIDNALGIFTISCLTLLAMGFPPWLLRWQILATTLRQGYKHVLKFWPLMLPIVNKVALISPRMVWFCQNRSLCFVISNDEMLVISKTEVFAISSLLMTQSIMRSKRNLVWILPFRKSEYTCGLFCNSRTCS